MFKNMNLVKKSWFAVVFLMCGLFTGCTQNKVPTSEHIVLFEASNSNMSEVSADDDYWSSMSYTIYYDGKVECVENYNISGDKENWWYLDKEQINDLYKMLEGEFQDYNEDYSACDGSAWSMKYYDVEGEVVHSFDGYIYDNETLEKIVVLINGNEY